MRLICETCDHGRPLAVPSCPWCGSGDWTAHTEDNIVVFDTECYSDYWLCMFSNGTHFEMYPGKPLDIIGLRREMSRATMVSFNGINYDMPLIAMSLMGAECATLKEASDAIIVGGLKWWELLKRYQIPPLDWVDHIDLMEVCPGQYGLKAYGAKMGTTKLQDLPIDPGSSIAFYDRARLREYCRNDLQLTGELYETVKKQIELREKMGTEYGLDLRSKSDAQIAEAVMKKILDRKIYPPPIVERTFKYKPPLWVKFERLNLLLQIDRMVFTVNYKGGIDAPPELDDLRINIGNSAYKMGSGGLHSQEECISHYADESTLLSDFDVASYYPALIINTGIFPPAIGEQFIEIYRGFRDERVSIKKTDKDKADMLKIFLNGTFGKLASSYSIFYSPESFIQVTLTGQLALLMLIERLESNGLRVVSGNTDGIIIKCRVDQRPIRDQLVAQWETETGLRMEETPYKVTHNRDVTNYINITTDGKVKKKGIFSDEGVFGSNPSGQVCIDAIEKFLTEGIPVEETILDCQDIRKFVYVRAVRGGGIYWPKFIVKPRRTDKNGKITLSPSKNYRRLVLGDSDDFDKYVVYFEQLKRATVYLGKTVRWYYANDPAASINYKTNDNLVPSTEGSVPCMDLPARLPLDINYPRYIEETYKQLTLLSV